MLMKLLTISIITRTLVVGNEEFSALDRTEDDYLQNKFDDVDGDGSFAILDEDLEEFQPVSVQVIKRNTDEIEGSGDADEIRTTTEKVIKTEIIINQTVETPKEFVPEKHPPDTPKILRSSLIPEEKKNVQIIDKLEEISGNETAKTGESTPARATTKDTTILIMLFGAVGVIGIGAFIYSFLKKRRQNHDDVNRLERGSNLKRSLQSLTKPEPEAKPLINENEVELKEIKNGTRENGDSKN